MKLRAPLFVEIHPRSDIPLGLLVKIGWGPYIKTDVLGLLKFIQERNR